MEPRKKKRKTSRISSSPTLEAGKVGEDTNMLTTRNALTSFNQLQTLDDKHSTSLTVREKRKLEEGLITSTKSETFVQSQAIGTDGSVTLPMNRDVHESSGSQVSLTPGSELGVYVESMGMFVKIQCTSDGKLRQFTEGLGQPKLESMKIDRPESSFLLVKERRSNSHIFPFLTLPAELREMIYKELFDHPEWYAPSKFPHKRAQPMFRVFAKINKDIGRCGLPFVNKQVFYETIPYLLSQKRFNIFDLRCFSGFMASLGPVGREHIQEVVIQERYDYVLSRQPSQIDSWSEFISLPVMSTIMKMKGMKNLKRLDIYGVKRAFVDRVFQEIKQDEHQEDGNDKELTPPAIESHALRALYDMSYGFFSEHYALLEDSA